MSACSLATNRSTEAGAFVRMRVCNSHPPTRFTTPTSSVGSRFNEWRLLLSYRGQIQVGSLTGAVHPSNDNAGVPRPAQRDQKSRVEHKGLCWLDPDFQYEHGR